MPQLGILIYNIAKTQLGVAVKEEDNVYINAIKEMEARDQDTKKQRESKNRVK